MRGYSIMRPVLLIAIALLTKTLVSNLCILFGMSPDIAENVSFIAMIIAALITFNQLNKSRRRK